MRDIISIVERAFVTIIIDVSTQTNATCVAQVFAPLRVRLQGASFFLYSHIYNDVK